MSLFNKILGFFRLFPFKTTDALNYLKTPVAKIFLCNSVLLIGWKLKGISESFLVDNFSFEKRNFKEQRWYTAITYSFSHFSFWHYAINMLALHLLGKPIHLKYGSKYVWSLYLLGAFTGSMFMTQFMPYDSITIPKVGANSAIASLFSFYAIVNPRLHLGSIFFIPIKLWSLLIFFTIFAFLSDPSQKTIGGMMTGMVIGLLFRRKLI